MIIPVLFSCKTSVQNNNQEQIEINSNYFQQGKAYLGDITLKSDPINIVEAKIEGNELVLKVGYSGGCQEHTFDLVGSSFISKSLPPIRNFKLIHNSNGDKCKMMVSKEIKFDISEFSYTKSEGSIIYLQSDQVKEMLTYVYKIQ